MTIDWEPVKADIHDLYHVRNKTLDDVMRIMRGRHGFSASSGSISYDSTNSTPSAIIATPEFSFNFPDPSSDIYTGEDDKTELHNAIINQDSQKVQCLLDRGTPVDTKDTAENEPLHNAVGGTLDSVLCMRLCQTVPIWQFC
ncbi:hypothetical protein CGCS363_v014147 [Colletotrichum siamense]|uniref:uncharacterized protein n=1 Tax=Colletotrichum siamense TaxID=690259 RepID=UPI0018733DAA|nr:uncharacterized protein CGCS363_v014147 [Colletotrichum siamense]KAF5484615.1 hypothetical protein CGCS363_v014147 [Colletotrichum siamense]